MAASRSAASRARRLRRMNVRVARAKAMPVKAPTAMPAMAPTPMLEEDFLAGGVEVADEAFVLAVELGDRFVAVPLVLAQPIVSGRVTFSLVQSCRLNAVAADGGQ